MLENEFITNLYSPSGYIINIQVNLLNELLNIITTDNKTHYHRLIKYWKLDTYAMTQYF